MIQFDELQKNRDILLPDHQQLMNTMDFLPDATFVIDNNKTSVKMEFAIVS